MITLSFLYKYRKRLKGFTFSEALRYVAKSLYGEVFRRRGPGSFGLRLIEINLTNRCQCSCLHCYADAMGETVSDAATFDGELSTQEVRDVLDQAAAMGALDISFTGGEPLLRQDLPDLVRHARKNGLLPKITTNGLLLTTAVISGLKRAGLGSCMVSIDSPRAAEHDEFRRYKGCSAKAISGLRELVRVGVPCGITTVARRSIINNGDLRGIAELGHQLGVDVVRILFPVLMGRFEGHFEEILTCGEREEVRRLTKDPIVVVESTSERSTCTAGITKINILTNGDVTPCVFVPRIFGNVRRNSLRAAWEHMTSFTQSTKPCGKCPMSDPAFAEQPSVLAEEMNSDASGAS